MFGAPGGAEWLIIIGVIVLLFVPSLLMFGVGFLVGKKAGEQHHAEPGSPHVDGVRIAATDSGVTNPAPGDTTLPGDDDE